MIRRAYKRSRPGEEAIFPSPDEIRRLTEEIREGWSPSQRARRAGHRNRVETPIISAPDLTRISNEEPNLL
jgi:hypothetical protein